MRASSRSCRRPTHPLLQLPNALCTPHIGYVERDNYENYFGIAFDHIVDFAAGRPVQAVNAPRGAA